MAHHEMTHHDVVGDSPADAEYLETPPGAGHEHTDANVWIIVRFMFWLAISAVIIHVGLGLLYAMLIERGKQTGEQRFPLAGIQGHQLPPAPRLQQKPGNELYDFRTGEENLLGAYGWVDKDAGTVHIPISDAMRLTLQRGLPSRSAEESQGAETPGLMPSDASSGRVMERRRQ